MPVNIKYFRDQFRRPYESTKKFAKWLENIKFIQNKTNCFCVDIGCGMGETLYYMAKKFPNTSFEGIDRSKNLIRLGKKIFKQKKINNVKLTRNNLYNFQPKLKPDLIVSLACLSWLNEIQKPLKTIAKMKSKKIAFTTLMYNGPIECIIKVKDYQEKKRANPKCSNYNVYSIPIVKKLLKKLGYKKFFIKKFEITKKLPEPKIKKMQTFTIRLQNGKNLQMSGPLHMPWYFFAAKK